MIDVGQTYPVTGTITDEAGNPENPSTAVLTITLPDGTTSTPTITLPPDETGLIRYDFRTTMAGLHQWTLITTSPDTATGDVFNVRRYVALISLAEAKAHLNITTTTHDDELRTFIMAAAQGVENKAGICVRRQFTERVEAASGGRLVMARWPLLRAISVTSVWAGGPSWAEADLRVDGPAGIVELAAAGGRFWWGPWNVVEEAGRVELSEPLLQANKELLRHLWETQRGSQPPSVLAGEEVFTTAAGFAFSYSRRVLELLEDEITPAV